MFRSVILCVLVGVSAAAFGADQWVVSPPRRSANQSTWYPRPLEYRGGTIRSIDRDRCQYLDAEGRLQSLPSYRILAAAPESPAAAQVQWSDIYLRRRDAIAKADTTAITKLDIELVSRFVPAMQSRPPVWRQQWMTAVTSGALMRMGRLANAYSLIEQLDERSLPPMTIAELPIAGFHLDALDGTATTAGVAGDTERLESRSVCVRLVAASRLLGSPRRGDAIAVLGKLSRAKDRPSVAAFARMLLLSVAPRSDLESRVDDVKRQLEKLPLVLRGGPTHRLATVYRRYGMNEIADELQAIAGAL
ncbi:MAG: hypothetical protein AAF958_08055 [Planctomycetota bacterium]